ncbi:uncharacterized protein LOC111203830 [Brassica napus]|uniref:uncharacterized protein LOC111203830 n=1 Tax=Brassica napus TaxID=3708 RepID=UPI000BBE36A7|nr:uncharacterized protein LOC111203830 [Brassica napus]
MKNIGSYKFKGGSDPIEADKWITMMEKNFETMECPEEYKKKINVYYLEADATGWWDSIDRQHGHTITSWESFKGEFERKYFPPEAKHRLERQFMNLVQGDRPPELGSRLAGSNFSSLSDLVEKAVNVETVLEAERKTLPHSGGHTKFSLGERPNFNKGPRSYKGKGRGFGGQANNRGNTVVCYICDQPGHISKLCPNRQRSNLQGYSSLRKEDVTCFFCGRKRHYASSCPNKPIHATPLAIRAPPSRPAIEPAPKKQNLGGRVYALGVENPDNAGPSSGPITGTIHVAGKPTHVLFDSGATHSFVTPEVAARFWDCFLVDRIDVAVLTPADRNLQENQFIKNVPLVIQGKEFVADLLVVPLKGYEVIL